MCPVSQVALVLGIIMFVIVVLYVTYPSNKPKQEAFEVDQQGHITFDAEESRYVIHSTCTAPVTGLEDVYNIVANTETEVVKGLTQPQLNQIFRTCSQLPTGAERMQCVGAMKKKFTGFPKRVQDAIMT